MKVIKEALLGKVSRLFKHGADAIRRFNTESYLRWLGEARRVGKADARPLAAGSGRLLGHKRTERESGRDEPRFSPARTSVLMSSAARRRGCCAASAALSSCSRAGNEPAEQKGRDGHSVSIPPRFGCGRPLIPSLIQHIWAVKAFFSFRRDISRLSTVLQPMRSMSGVSTTQQLLWLMERPIRLYIFIKDCLVSS